MLYIFILLYSLPQLSAEYALPLTLLYLRLLKRVCAHVHVKKTEREKKLLDRKRDQLNLNHKKRYNFPALLFTHIVRYCFLFHSFFVC